MTNSADVITITMRKHAWWFWVLAGLWLQLYASGKRHG